MDAGRVPGSGEASVRFRPQPLWVRVDRNRVKLAIFVVAFVAGSALLLTAALVAVPGSLFGAVFTADEPTYASEYWRSLARVLVIAIGILLAAGSVAAAVQLANAEDWVRNRFKGATAPRGSQHQLEELVAGMAIAGGLAAAPRVVILDTAAVNAYALGTARSKAVIGVTKGFLVAFSAEEQRAVIAALVARIVSGDILFATALAALMGPLKAIRSSGKAITSGGCASGGCGNALMNEGCSGITDTSDGCGCLFDSLGDTDNAGGCLGAVGIGLFLVVIAAITYVAVVGAAWIVTIWGRLLHRTAYEKADAEGMLLLKDPQAMLSALTKAIAADTTILDGDPSYDGIFYTPTSGTPRVERNEHRRLRRLAEVLGVEGAIAVDGAPQGPRG